MHSDPAATPTEDSRHFGATDTPIFDALAMNHPGVAPHGYDEAVVTHARANARISSAFGHRSNDHSHGRTAEETESGDEGMT